MLKRFSSHCCKVKTLWKLARLLSRYFSWLLEVTFSRKSLVESEWSDGFQPEKFVKVIEHVNTSIVKWYICQFHGLDIHGAVTF